MATEPKQARSADSARRMLEAGEELFLTGGSDALKLEAIIERAGTSTGSFYARFGSMQGYLDALHDRALVQIEESLAPVLARAAEQTSLDDALRVVVEGTLKVLRRDRASLYYFAVGGTQAPHTRERGTQFVLGFREALMHLASHFINDPTSPDAERRLDIMWRMFAAMAFQQIMFDQPEISPLRLSDTRLAREWAAALSASVAEFAAQPQATPP
jgi:AcrR family transcriptional regulator